MSLTLVKPSGGQSADSDLVRGMSAGDLTALEALMRRYNQRLYRVARGILRNEADAEEAVQEAFYLAYRAIGKFRGDSALSTWLVRIVVNESNKKLHKNRRLSTLLEFDDVSGGAEDMRTTIDDFSPYQPEQSMARVQIRQLLETKIDQLPDAFRSVFMLRAVEEMTVDETARCLGIPEATVRSRYFRARGLLRKSLAREIGGNLDQVFAFAGDRCDRIVAGVLARLRA